MYDIKKMSIEEKVGQMIGFAFKGTEYTEELKMQIEEMKVGLVILFKDNCANPKQVFDLNKEINKHAKIPPFISLDQEGGMVARVTEGITQSPGAMPISATRNPKNAYKLAYNMGRELQMLGFNFNFAPVGDVNNNPKNPVINVRSYSEDPDIVSEYVVEAVNGYSDALMMSSIKHFPGHGDTAVDSHIGLPVVDFDKKRLYEMELKPFIKAKELDLPGIMVSHVLFTKYDDKYPSTLSKKVVQGLLRDEIGYEGLVVTDSLTMKAVFDNFTIEEIAEVGFNSGDDILLMCGARDINLQRNFFDAAVKLVKEGKIKEEVLDRAVERIFKYKKQFIRPMANDFKDIEKDLCNKEAVEFSEKVSLDSITLIDDNKRLLPISKEEKTLIVFPKIQVVTLVENDEMGLMSLAEFMPFACDKIYMPLSPENVDKELLLKKQEEYDKIIYCSYNACFNPEQAALINSLDKNKLIVIAIRTPYDYGVLENVSTYICSYEATPLAFKSLAKVLSGEAEAKGKIPVTIKEA